MEHSENLKSELEKLKNKKQAEILQRFFKTGKGEYGEGDVFLGIKVPVLRGVAKKYDLEIEEIQKLLESKVHEHRMCALFVLVKKFETSKSEDGKKGIFAFYTGNTKGINNWDLVDLSAPNIAGNWLLNKKGERKILHEFARSNNLWKKRIAMISTYSFIREKDFSDAFAIAEILLNDEHDLIHKAVGWMLREIGKGDQNAEEKFLKKHYKKMPRTMLRYAIEKFSEEKRKFYMAK